MNDPTASPTVSLFDEAFDAVIGHEGGFQNNPRDPGNFTPAGVLKGTKYGISARTYPDLDIRHITLSEAKRIYRRDVWEKIKGDSLPRGVGYFVFDYAVHSGPTRAIIALQRAVSVADDGIVGPITLSAVQSANPVEILGCLYMDRKSLLTRISYFNIFASGWLARIGEVLARAEQLVSTA